MLPQTCLDRYPSPLETMLEVVRRSAACRWGECRGGGHREETAAPQVYPPPACPPPSSSSPPPPSSPRHLASSTILRHSLHHLDEPPRANIWFCSLYLSNPERGSHRQLMPLLFSSYAFAFIWNNTGAWVLTYGSLSLNNTYTKHYKDSVTLVYSPFHYLVELDTNL